MHWCARRKAEPKLDLSKNSLQTVIERATYLAQEDPVVECVIREWANYKQVICTGCSTYIKTMQVQHPAFIENFFARLTFAKLFKNGLWTMLASPNPQLFPSFNHNLFHRATLKEAIATRLKNVDHCEHLFQRQWKTSYEVLTYAQTHLTMQCQGVISRFQQATQCEWAEEFEKEMITWSRRTEAVSQKIQADEGICESQYAYENKVREMVRKFQNLLSEAISSHRHPNMLSLFLTTYEKKAGDNMAEMEEMHHLRAPYTVDQTQQVVEYNGCRVALRWIALVKQFLPTYQDFLQKCKTQLLPKTRELRKVWSSGFENELCKLQIKYQNLYNAFAREGQNIEASLDVQEQVISEWRTARREHAVVMDNMNYQRSVVNAIIDAMPPDEVVSRTNVPADWAADVHKAMAAVRADRNFNHDEQMQREAAMEQEIAHACRVHVQEEQAKLLAIFNEIVFDTDSLKKHVVELRTWVSPYSEMELNASVAGQEHPPPWVDVNYVVTHDDHMNMLLNVRELWNSWQLLMTGKDALLASHRSAAKDMHALVNENKPRSLGFYWKCMPSVFEVQACVSVFR